MSEGQRHRQMSFLTTNDKGNWLTRTMKVIIKFSIVFLTRRLKVTLVTQNRPKSKAYVIVNAIYSHLSFPFIAFYS